MSPYRTTFFIHLLVHFQPFFMVMSGSIVYFVYVIPVLIHSVACCCYCSLSLFLSSQHRYCPNLLTRVPFPIVFKPRFISLFLLDCLCYPLQKLSCVLCFVAFCVNQFCTVMTSSFACSLSAWFCLFVFLQLLPTGVTSSFCGPLPLPLIILLFWVITHQPSQLIALHWHSKHHW